MIHLHTLHGCAPTPLAHYLKALATLRLVAEQADPGARGAWRDGGWVLATTLDEAALIDFFLHRYRPTPLVAPWNNGSGFYAGDKPKAKRALEGMARQTDERFEPYLKAIDAAREVVGTNARASTDKAEKGLLISRCFNEWRGAHRDVLAAAAVIDNEGHVGFPSLLGTGLNLGNLDLSTNFMQRLLQLLSDGGEMRADAGALLGEALWRRLTRGMDRKGAIGQFVPGGAGGANSSSGPTSDAFTNPWDFILAMEGAVLFSASSARRLGAKGPARMSAPFTVYSHGAGFRTSSASDDVNSNGEQWMPLWHRLTSLPEVRQLLTEGRAQVGARLAERPLDLARAVARLGVARGITHLERYGYMKRLGESNLAVPLGRIEVAVRPRSQLVDDIAAWMDRLNRAARDKSAPARLQNAERRLADAVFEALTGADLPARWQAVLLALTGIERVQASGTGIAVGPVPPLRPDWVAAADDASAAFRLAVALASTAAGFDAGGRPRDPVRHHFLPLERGARAFATQGRGLAHDVRVVASGRDAVSDLLALVDRRLVEAGQGSQRRLPLVAAHRAAATAGDLGALLAGAVDLDACVGLARALMPVRWSDWARHPVPFAGHAGSDVPDDAWMALRLAVLPWPLDEHTDIPVDPTIVRRLAGGDACRALDTALQRLAAKGLRPPLAVGTTDPSRARLWGAALAFPVSRSTARRFVRHLAAVRQGA